MDIEDSLRPELWGAIADSYGRHDYTAAIRDAISLITSTLRDKTGLDGDGQELVGRALGFSKSKPPLIAVNRLQTETERSIQIGLLETMKGIYSLIRNPRSHEKYDDDKKTADSIISFTDFLLGFLGESQQTFTPAGFLTLVTDPYFPNDSEYVEGLVAGIPVRKLYDTLVTVYRNRTWKQSDNYALVVKATLAKLADSQVSDFLQVVSSDLQHTTKEADISLVIKILPEDLWQRLDRLPRIRIEKALIGMLTGAWYVPESGKTNSPTSTWISSIAAQFLRKSELRATILAKLANDDFDHHNFVAQHLIDDFPHIFETKEQARLAARALAAALRKGNSFLKNRVASFLQMGIPAQWSEELMAALKEFTDPDHPEYYTWDGLAIFGNFDPKPNPHAKIDEDEIPF